MDAQTQDTQTVSSQTQNVGGQTTDTQTTTPAPASAQTASPIPQTGEQTENVYNPNYKFKVVDEEKEFDDFVKPIIKNKELEEKFRDLYTKAHGLEPMKTRLKSELEQIKSEASDFKTKHTNLIGQLDVLSHYVNAGDFDNFFKNLRIPEQAIYKWVQAKAREQDMSPEERADVQRRRDENERLYHLEKQNQDLMQRFEQAQVEQGQAQLRMILARPEVSSIQQAFDTQVGQPGAFMNEIIRRGVAYHALNGVDLPPEQVVQEVMQTFGKVVNPMTGQTTQAVKPAIIPNVAGKSSSPVKQAPKSIADLKKIAEAMV
jgi:hypothetical protein